MGREILFENAAPAASSAILDQPSSPDCPFTGSRAGWTGSGPGSTGACEAGKAGFWPAEKGTGVRSAAADKSGAVPSTTEEGTFTRATRPPE